LRVADNGNEVSMSGDPLDQWLRDSIDRGCTLESMVEAMIASGHAENLALLIVTAAFARFKPQALELAQDANGGEKVLRIFSGGNGRSDASSQPATITAQQPAAPAKAVRANDAATALLDPIAIEGNVIHLAERDVQVMMVCTSPRIALFENLLSDAECDALIKASRGKLQRSKVVSNRGEGEYVDETRTSYGTWFDRNEHPLATKIQRRICELLRAPLAHAEPLQILNYAEGGEYLPHFDYFETEGLEAQQPGMVSPLQSGGQRIATMVVYLNDVPAGGGTIFPHIHLETRPKKGGALYFSYQLADGSVDPMTLHGGSPVLRGEKWICTQWIREGVFGQM
jgi:prolyl 4-hydroxylase